MGIDDYQSELSPAEEAYIIALHMNERAKSEVYYDVFARSHGMHNTTAAEMVKKLAAKRLVCYGESQPVRMTQKGKAAAIAIEMRNYAIKRFFTDVLDVSEEKANDVANKFGHSFTQDIMDSVNRLTEIYSKSPCKGCPLAASQIRNSYIWDVLSWL